ncbi:hypothetical protein [Acidithiobacillus acidisediminis]|jgi:hypothetical protein|uniref:hypothetical protein n=1 Tax=Acidithiobacillus TaxID=119977 RepID=UPI00200F8AFF|nr:hypothetical protein [Acidithiobacillus sp. S30A2]MCL5052074.1 hypothetical protein [Gammaproteobacteria bacterium]
MLPSPFIPLSSISWLGHPDPAIHDEIVLEAEICSDLASQGWLYTPPQGTTISPDDHRYDRDQALFPPDLLDWIQETQPQSWERLQKALSRDKIIACTLQTFPTLLKKIRKLNEAEASRGERIRRFWDPRVCMRQCGAGRNNRLVERRVMHHGRVYWY